MAGGTILTPPYTSHFDGNQVPTIMGVEGTLGTADTSGTARPLPFAIDPSTGALYTKGGIGTTVVSDANYAVRVDDGNSGTTIVGEAAPGASGTAAVWRMKKVVDTAGTQTVVTWADGDANFDNIWNNRGTYSFS